MIELCPKCQHDIHDEKQCEEIIIEAKIIGNHQPMIGPILMQLPPPKYNVKSHRCNCTLIKELDKNTEKN